MAQVIGFNEWKTRRQTNGVAATHRVSPQEAVNDLSKDLTQLLREAHANKGASLGERVAPTDFKQFVSGRIGGILLDQKLIDPSFFLCGLYIAELLTDTMHTQPESWYAIDFRQKGNDTNDRFAFKNGGDMCFLIAAVFPERGHFRLMTPEYYEKMGIGFYYEFYYRGGSEIGYHMGSRFKTMADITQSCLTSL